MKRHAARPKQTNISSYFKKARASSVESDEELQTETAVSDAPSPSEEPQTLACMDNHIDLQVSEDLGGSAATDSEGSPSSDEHEDLIQAANGCDLSASLGDFSSATCVEESKGADNLQPQGLVKGSGVCAFPGHSSTSEAHERVLMRRDSNEVGDASSACSDSRTSGAITANPLDLGLFVSKSVNETALKEKLMRNPWTPPCNYIYPATTKRNLRFKPHWVASYPWLTYSEHLEGALCKYCVVFAHECAGKGEHQRLGSFVTKAFVNYKNAMEAFKSHAACGYHLKSTSLAESFLAIQSGAHRDIVSQLDQGVRKQAEENRKNLLPIIETVIFCGRQELSLRGTDDCGPLDLSQVLPVKNDGNFRALLRMRATCGDASLKKHIETSAANAMYTSPRIQNELIALSGKIIQKKIVDRVNASECFSVLADEATDISRTAQLSLCVRYVDHHSSEHAILREDFVDFIPVYDLTGKALAGSILSSLRCHGFNVDMLCGQGYDGAASMSGHLNGVQAIIRETVPRALYVHCSAHSLNLALLHSCKLSSIRNCLGTVSSICTYVRASPQRTNQLQDEVLHETQEKKSVLSFCQTRWVESHDALQRFLELYTPIIRFLEDLEEGTHSDASSKASQLLSAITKPEFVVSLQVASQLFSFTLPLCKFLQKVDCDLSQACDYVDDIINILSEKRRNSETEFKKIFEQSCSLLHDVNVEMTLPRIVGRQSQRSNAPSVTPEEHYRRNVYLPLLSDLENQLKERFENHKKVVVGLHMLLPKFCASASLSGIHDAVEFYLGDIASAHTLAAELALWMSKCSRIVEADRPACALQALSMCNSEFFPNVYHLLCVLATLPVSTSTPERTFSTLRRLKNYLRNPMKQERLTGLALLSVHREIEVAPAEVLEDFCKLPRKKNFVV